MARFTAWWPRRSNEIEEKWKVRDGAGRKEMEVEEEVEEVQVEERVDDKKQDNGREEEDGYEGGWRFLNMPLWSMKKRKSEMG